MFSKKATKIDEIFPSIWHYVVRVKSSVKILSNFVALLENTELYYAVAIFLPDWK